MGGLRCKLPITWAMMLIGTLALTGFGIPQVAGFAGFYSKDAIIEAAYAAHTPGNYAFWLLVIAAFMTSFYSLAPDVHDLPRNDARRPAHLQARAREPAGDAGAARRAGAVGAVVAGAGRAVLHRRES